MMRLFFSTIYQEISTRHVFATKFPFLSQKEKVIVIKNILFSNRMFCFQFERNRKIIIQLNYVIYLVNLLYINDM